VYPQVGSDFRKAYRHPLQIAAVVFLQAMLPIANYYWRETEGIKC